MIHKAKISLLAVMAAVGMAAQAQGAALNLDLRYAPGQTGVGGNGKTAELNPAAGGANLGTYQVQLWAQITDPSHSWSTDLVNALAFSVQSNQVTPVGAISGGGITAINISTVTSTSHTDGLANSGTTVDGVADWGAAATSPAAIINSWSGWAN